MSRLLAVGLTPQEQHRLMEQMYGLLGSQVKSYHKHRHMGDNSSVSVELAQELLESMRYTMGTISPEQDVESALRSGQAVLEEKLHIARKKLHLVEDTVPDWQSECRWDALRCLDHFLQGYDHRHLAHRIPEDLFYPTPFPEPEQKGIDYALYYVNLLWLENQIMAAGEEKTAQLWEILSRDMAPVNQCQQLVIQLLGKSLLDSGWERVTFSDAERDRLLVILREAPLEAAVPPVCRFLELTEDACRYVRQTALQLLPRLEGAVEHGNLAGILL